MMPINSLAAADSVIIPSQPSFLSAKGLDLLMQSISKVKRQINPKLKIDGILPTKQKKSLLLCAPTTARKSVYSGRKYLFPCVPPKPAAEARAFMLTTKTARLPPHITR